jgi:hypothetical protein
MLVRKRLPLLLFVTYPPLFIELSVKRTSGSVVCVFFDFVLSMALKVGGFFSRKIKKFNLQALLLNLSLFPSWHL